MAQNLVVNFIGNNRLSKTTSVISNDLRKMGQTTDKISRGMSRALGALGIGLGLTQLTSALKEASKAAIEDSKSQAQLALALKNTLGATQDTIAGAERFISRTQLQTSVLDDELRPALATAVRATGSLTKGQELLNLALDVSAGTGKDLNTVTKALARAQAGQLGGLQRLVPGIKKGDDAMGQLRKQFAGAAEIAANQDPYKRIQVIFNELQETIGRALVPSLQEMAKYLASPEGQKTLQGIVREFVNITKAIGNTIKFLIQNIDLIKQIITLLVGVRIGYSLVTVAVKLYTMQTTLAAAATRALKFAIASTGVGLLIIAIGELAAAFMGATDATDNYNKSLEGILNNTEKLKKASDNAWAQSWVKRGEFYMNQVKDKADAIDQALKEKTDKIKKTAETFRDSVGLAFGTAGTDEYSVFNVDKVINKLKRMVDAAKGFAANLKKLTKAGAGQDVINELVGMGPAQGNIVAKGLLQSGRLSEYLGLRGSLQMTGTQVGTVAADTGEKTYTINVNKANVTAADIIKEIRKFEKQTGKKYFVN
jgi:hypothetical protein